ncbi:MAG: hypothetical protein CBC35_04925 [Planctomycetes bacterium TMED75]|nr:hypothetical protein [Planctomycetaceae bacterium]OUU93832.1 MAG: hypothetical protein CBC35_04925 [Planctomycetes bacterium TMED75]
MRTPPLALVPLIGLLSVTSSSLGLEEAVGPTPALLDSPFVRSIQPSPWSAFSAATIQVDLDLLNAIAERSRAEGDVLVRGVPLGADLSVDMRLHEVSAIHPGSRFVIVEADPNSPSGSIEVELDAPDIVVLAGHIDGSPDDKALLAHGDMGTMGYVRRGGRTFMISSGQVGSGKPALSFDTGLLPEGALELMPLECTLLAADGSLFEEVHEVGESGFLAGGLPCRKVSFALDTDNEYLSDLFGGNSDAANAYTALLLAATTEVYVDQFNTNLEIDYLRLWSSPDPWSAGSTSAELNSFVSYWQSNMGDVSRDLAHLLSGRNLGGGIAYLGGLCGGSSAYALSANLNGSFPYPIVDNSSQNWDLMVFAHETGHSFGSGHTHDSYNPPIDGCANGDCSVAPEGTIMSYCHTCSGGLSNVRMIFHPRVETVIRDRLNSISCDYTGSGEGATAVDDQFAASSVFGSTLALLENDSELSCGAISITQLPATSQQGAVLNLLPNAVDGLDAVQYIPTPGFFGVDEFSYQISDNLGNTSTADVDVVIDAEVTINFVGGAPAVVVPNMMVEVYVSGTGVDIDASTVVLSISQNGSSTFIPMSGAGEDTFTAQLPAELDCPGPIVLQVSVDATTGQGFLGDPVSSSVGFELENFENPSQPAWVVTGDVSTPETGMWGFGFPDGSADRGDPDVDFDGSGQCVLTGVGTGNTDVDGGCTILRSPRVVADDQTIVTWAQWYDNTGSGIGGSPGADVFVVEISNDFGSNWVLVDEAGPSDSSSVGGWIVQEIQVSSFVEPTNQVVLRWTACDNGDGSVIEAAIDSYGFGACEVIEFNAADFNLDGFVDGLDLAVVLASWNQAGSTGDANGDGICNALDLASVLAGWSASQP